MISEELLKRKEEDWSPFMERLEKVVRRKRRAKKIRLSALFLFIAAASAFVLTGTKKEEKSYLSAKIPSKYAPVIAVEGGWAVEKNGSVWLVINSGDSR